MTVPGLLSPDELARIEWRRAHPVSFRQTNEDLVALLAHVRVVKAERDEWVDECSGLAYMIQSIAARYREAKQGLGGDSELLSSSIVQAEWYVGGSLREKVKAARAEGKP